MTDPKCPFCGEEMTAKSAFYDRFSGKYSAHAKCWPCGAQGPIVKSSTEKGAINLALKHALKRPLRRPVRWPLIETYLVVWLEEQGEKDVIPAFPTPANEIGVMRFLTAAQEFITVYKYDYGTRWRAWPAQPTQEERRSMEWM